MVTTHTKLRAAPGRPVRPHRPRAGLLGGSLVAAGLLLAGPARADEPFRQKDIQLTMGKSGWYDAGFIATMTGGILLGSLVLQPRMGDVAPLDGGGHRDWTPDVGRASDYAVAVGVATGLGLTQLTELGHGASGAAALRAPLVVAEGALAGAAIVQLLKNAFGVCRPRDWREAERRCSEDGESLDTPDNRRAEAHRSFPSGHNAPLAGMAGAAFGLYMLPSNHRPEYLPVALTSLGFAFSTVLLRVKAGAHSWVDTGAAFALGTAAGFLTAALHLRSTPTPGATPVPAQPSSTPLLSFGGTF